MAGIERIAANLFDSPIKLKLYQILWPSLSESERGDAFLSISMMNDSDILKLIKTFPQGKPTIVSE